MELFQEQLTDIRLYLQRAEQVLTSSVADLNKTLSWPEDSSLVLQDDIAIELGGAAGSQLVILWTTTSDAVDDNTISLVGPDLETAAGETLPLSLVILVSGTFDDAYGTYQALQDVVIDTTLKGISLRIWPDRQKIWCRVSREAIEAGFSLKHYAFSIWHRLKALPEVEKAEIIVSTDPLIEGQQLAGTAEKAKIILETLINIYDQETFDCDHCDYRETCAEVEGLKEIHKRLHEEKREW